MRASRDKVRAVREHKAADPDATQDYLAVVHGLKQRTVSYYLQRGPDLYPEVGWPTAEDLDARMIAEQQAIADDPQRPEHNRAVARSIVRHLTARQEGSK